MTMTDNILLRKKWWILFGIVLITIVSMITLGERQGEAIFLTLMLFNFLVRSFSNLWGRALFWWLMSMFLGLQLLFLELYLLRLPSLSMLTLGEITLAECVVFGLVTVAVTRSGPIRESYMPKPAAREPSTDDLGPGKRKHPSDL